MNNEMMFLWTKALKQELKRKVKGVAHCHIIDNTLIIDIYAVNSIVFHYTQEIKYSEIVQGFTARRCAEEISKSYTEYIKRLFFL